MLVRLSELIFSPDAQHCDNLVERYRGKCTGFIAEQNAFCKWYLLLSWVSVYAHIALYVAFMFLLIPFDVDSIGVVATVVLIAVGFCHIPAPFFSARESVMKSLTPFEYQTIGDGLCHKLALNDRRFWVQDFRLTLEAILFSSLVYLVGGYGGRLLAAGFLSSLAFSSAIHYAEHEQPGVIPLWMMRTASFHPHYFRACLFKETSPTRGTKEE